MGCVPDWSGRPKFKPKYRALLIVRSLHAKELSAVRGKSSLELASLAEILEQPEIAHEMMSTLDPELLPGLLKGAGASPRLKTAV